MSELNLAPGFVDRDTQRRKDYEVAWLLQDKELESLNLPPLLEQRRREFKIAAGYFDREYLWDNCLVCQIEDTEGDSNTFIPGGLIEKPFDRKEYDKASSYVGVIVSAGLAALNKLRSNGVDLGHIVTFSRYTPFQPQVDVLGNRPVHGIELMVGDIKSSMDLALQKREGKVRVDTTEYQNNGYTIREHEFVDANGNKWAPLVPDHLDNF